MMRNSSRDRKRNGFVSTFMVLAVMTAISIIGMMCARLLLAQRQTVERGLVSPQMEAMVAAACDWLNAGGTIEDSERKQIVLSDEGTAKICRLELFRKGNTIHCSAKIERHGKLLASREFTLDGALAN